MEQKEKPTVTASMLTPVLEKGEFFRGNADINARPEELVTIGLEIQVGDCARDGIMPPASKMKEIRANRSRREMLSGKIRKDNDRAEL